MGKKLAKQPPAKASVKVGQSAKIYNSQVKYYENDPAILKYKKNKTKADSVLNVIKNRKDSVDSVIKEKAKIRKK